MPSGPRFPRPVSLLVGLYPASVCRDQPKQGPRSLPFMHCEDVVRVHERKGHGPKRVSDEHWPISIVPQSGDSILHNTPYRYSVYSSRFVPKFHLRLHSGSLFPLPPADTAPGLLCLCVSCTRITGICRVGSPQPRVRVQSNRNAK